MGKPLGLGTVRIDPIAMLFVSRSDRYAAPGDSALSTGRYDYGWFLSPDDVDRLPNRYGRECVWIKDHKTEGQTLIHLQGPAMQPTEGFWSGSATPILWLLGFTIL
jgi:hypothetical protein